ncbi:MAG: hypothetical protein AAF226_13030, partial [Verrucomicrobiota bacterium]
MIKAGYAKRVNSLENFTETGRILRLKRAGFRRGCPLPFFLMETEFQQQIEKAAVLIEALPYLQEFRGQT